VREAAAALLPGSGGAPKVVHVLSGKAGQTAKSGKNAGVKTSSQTSDDGDGVTLLVALRLPPAVEGMAFEPLYSVSSLSGALSSAGVQQTRQLVISFSGASNEVRSVLLNPVEVAIVELSKKSVALWELGSAAEAAPPPADPRRHLPPPPARDELRVAVHQRQPRHRAERVVCGERLQARVPRGSQRPLGLGCRAEPGGDLA
jgi:hypothetical protein